MKWIFALSFFFSIQCLAVLPKEQVIHWAITDFPPFLELASEDPLVDIEKAQGPFAQIYRELVIALPQFEHKFIRATFQRAEKLFTSQKQFCTLLLQETPEREKYLIFGAEVARALPIGLVVNKVRPEALKKYFKNEEVDLEGLVKSEGFRLGVTSGRSYSESIDRIIENSSDSFKLVSDKAAGNLFMMLENRRIDGVLSYVLEDLRYEKVNKDAAFQFFLVKQAPAFISVRVSCEKSDWGRQVIPTISNVIKEKNVRQKVYHYFLKNLPEGMKGRYRDIYKMEL